MSERVVPVGRRFYRRAKRSILDLVERVVSPRGADYLGVNIEGFLNYNFTIRFRNPLRGVSAMLRVKNEAEKIVHCLGSIVELFDEIVLVDNNSSDDTLERVRRFKQAMGGQDKIKLLFYPFQISRCGPENEKTPETSVASLAYYYNWALSHCTYTYVCKWDGDMILKPESGESFRSFLKDIQDGMPKCWYLYGQTVYRDMRGDFFLSKEEINKEIMLFPYGSRTRYRKLDLYEDLVSVPPLPPRVFDEVVFYELKFVDENEFSHWSSTEFASGRKKLEWQNFHEIRSGSIDPSRFEKISFDDISKPVVFGKKGDDL